ncbi:phosphoribosylglycinamide formyltransferase [Listeria floridensis FSL S10-1187]|uniref:Phosphoribosylglycinamide formyltransferase n=1 Tax=Listeria floridensis FSL S10-1187 TaxID=1265817 RepID=A0ABN0RDJ8_9LIST|nr:phosphoribosylglycinamide formyltransferase [Listeria floridensis]EUJ29209.1 phosphoribosylglycinamide formyltransferase [Listeria floridensis FSL S10-1187]
MRIAIFASGSGSNFEALMQDADIRQQVAVLVCDKPGAKVLERANKFALPTVVFSARDFPDKASYEKLLLDELSKFQVDFIVLAGYMRLLGDTMLAAFSDRIVNLHPSLLPLFPGKDAIGQALRAGVSVTGVTAHYVDAGMDTGQVIAQEELKILSGETLPQLEERIHALEHRFYPAVVKKMMLKGDE